MTDTTATLSDKQLADNVREAARALAAAWNVAADAGLTVEVGFIETREFGKPMPNVIPDARVRRVTTEVL